MAVNPAVGAQYGYSPEAWAALTSAQRAAIKGGAIGTGLDLAQAGLSGGTVGYAPVASDAPAYDPYAGTATADPYSGSGYGSGAVSRGSLDADPGWLGINAELDQSLGTYQADAARQSALAGAERDRLLGDLTQRGDIERQNVEGGMLSRGLYRSGETEVNLARQRANELSRSSAITAGAQAKISDIEGALALQAAQLEQKRAEARAQYLSMGYQ